MDNIVSAIRQEAGTQTRVFSFGVGSSVDANLVRRMAAAGCGAAEFVVEGESMDAKVMRQLRRALSPALINVQYLFSVRCFRPFCLTRVAGVVEL